MSRSRSLPCKNVHTNVKQMTAVATVASVDYAAPYDRIIVAVNVTTAGLLNVTDLRDVTATEYVALGWQQVTACKAIKNASSTAVICKVAFADEVT